jgi:hypothetical protein
MNTAYQVQNAADGNGWRYTLYAADDDGVLIRASVSQSGKPDYLRIAESGYIFESYNLADDAARAYIRDHELAHVEYRRA